MSWYDLENKITLVTRRTGQSCVTAVQEFAGVYAMAGTRSACVALHIERL